MDAKQATDEAMVNVAIEDTANLSGWRIYGGHVYVAAGTVRFLNCHFWDTMVIMPLTDVVAFGGDVLVSEGGRESADWLASHPLLHASIHPSISPIPIRSNQ